MRFLIAAAGSRGDTQPLLALSVALTRAGHQVLFTAAPTFAEEAHSFGIDFRSVGRDPVALFAEHKEMLGTLSPVRGFRVMNAILRDELRLQFEQLAPLAKGMDVVVAGGAHAGARSVAEAYELPFFFVAYAPELLRSRDHSPILIPARLPRLLNPLAWSALTWFYDRMFGSLFNGNRKRLGLGPVKRILAHVFDPSVSLLAADPELAPVPRDVRLPRAPTGAWHLPDQRPLGGALEAFLAAGEAPIYVGFGSMPDPTPELTTKLIVAAARKAGTRLLLSSGWAKLGGDSLDGLGDDVFVVGSTNHGRLFPKVAAVIHHGGAGTTQAAARAGVPQGVVPHAFDQFNWARRAQRSGVAPGHFARTRLSVGRLAGMMAALRDERMRAAAKELGEKVRGRDGLATAVRYLAAH